MVPYMSHEYGSFNFSGPPMPQYGAPVQHAPLGPQGVVVSPMVWTEIMESVRAIQHQVVLTHIALKDLSVGVSVLREVALRNSGDQPPIFHPTPQRLFRRGMSRMEVHTES
jgi:hypothetical protein